jgi:GxxExxY protein
VWYSAGVNADSFFNPDEVNEITEKVIGCLFKVSNTPGGGFLEKVYENAGAIEIAKQAWRFASSSQ